MKLLLIVVLSILFFFAGWSKVNQEYITSRSVNVEITMVNHSRFIDVEQWEAELTSQLSDPKEEYSIENLRAKIIQHEMVSDAMVKWTWINGFEVRILPLKPIASLFDQKLLKPARTNLLFENGQNVSVLTATYSDLIQTLPVLNTDLFLTDTTQGEDAAIEISEVLGYITELKLDVQEVEVTPWGHWTLLFSDDSKAVLGSHQLETRVELLADIKSKVLCSHGDDAVIDLRYNNAFAVNCQI